MMAIFVVLVFLGFPGKLDRIVGSGVCSLIEYGSFGLQFFLVIMASGDDLMGIRLINFKPAYPIVYFFTVYVSVVSMIVTIDKKSEMITLLHVVLTVLFAIWLVERYTTKELLEIVYSAQFIFFSLTMICIVIFPNVAFYKLEGVRTIGGLFKTKNEFGTQLSFGILIQCILLRMRIQKHERVSLFFWGMMAGQFALVVLSKNFGALLIVIIFVAYIFMYGRSKNKKRLPLGSLFVIITLGFLAFALTVLQWLEPLLASVGKSVTLTGRVPLWQQCITVMMEKNTLTGYGYEMFWRTPSAVDAFHAGFPEFSWAATTSSSMHNTMMELWCNIGLLGVALYYIMFLVAEKGVKYLDENEYLFCSSYMVMFAVRSLTERQNDPGTFYMLFLFVVLCLMLRAKLDHKLKIRKKARIFEQTGEEATVDDSSDLAVFQKRFSNFSDSPNERKWEPSRRSVAFQRGKSYQDPDEEENKLASLLREFDDDDNG